MVNNSVEMDFSHSQGKNVRFSVEDEEMMYEKAKLRYEANQNITMRRKWGIDRNGYIFTQS